VEKTILILACIHGTFLAPMDSNSDNSDIGFLGRSPSRDGGGVSTKCRRNPGFLPERGFLVRIIPWAVMPSLVDALPCRVP
jgi:hypothetical protein